MAVEDIYDPSVLLLVDAVTEYFEEAGLAVGVDYGDRAIGRQLNAGEEGRVVLVLVGGTYKGPGKSGSKSRTAAMRNAYTLVAEVEVHIWAWDDSAPEDDKAQERAWFRLHEYTLAALRSDEQGRFAPLRLTPIRKPVELRHGIARTMLISIEVPVHYPPDDEPKLEATAEVTMKVVQPQGEDAEGEQIPPLESDVAEFTVEGEE
jgi:hypothetical protein